MAEAEGAPGAPGNGVFASRRRFIEVGIAAVAAAWAGTAVGTRLFPEAAARVAGPVSFSLSELPVGAALEISYAGAPAIVLRSTAGLRAYSMVCTHLGCTIEWQPGLKQFHCPCHDGRFDEFGEVLAGPPAVPLEQLALKVENEKVVVG